MLSLSSSFRKEKGQRAKEKMEKTLGAKPAGTLEFNNLQILRFQRHD